MMSEPQPHACLNCGGALAGPFCAQCGQRDVPAYPTVREMAGDAWRELSGWDGRFVTTVKTLVTRPGQLTVDAVEGRRVRYIKPLRLYLVVSLLYFLLAAASPNLRERAVVMPGGMVKLDVLADNQTPEQRAEIERVLERAPWWAKALMEPMLRDPAAFRRRMLERVSHVFFALVPILALVLAAFYRRRRYVQHLTFALHLETMAFAALSLPAVASFTRSLAAVGALQAGVGLFLLWYLIAALRRVYGGGWASAIARGIGFALVYAMVVAIAMLGTVIVTAVA